MSTALACRFWALSVFPFASSFPVYAPVLAMVIPFCLLCGVRFPFAARTGSLAFRFLPVGVGVGWRGRGGGSYVG